MLVIGELGTGKSALKKSHLLRQLAFGRRAVSINAKGEEDHLDPGEGNCRLMLIRALGRAASFHMRVSHRSPASALRSRSFTARATSASTAFVSSGRIRSVPSGWAGRC